MKISVRKSLFVSFLITIIIFTVELAGGLLSNSLALLSDAGHVLTDAFALGLSIIAAMISLKPSDLRATFGYQRVGLLAAVINGTSLLVIAGFIFFESYERFLSPPDIRLSLMMPVALGGLAANVVMALLLSKGHEDLNIRSAWLHVLGDALSSIGVIVSGAVIYLTGWLYADPLASAVIGIVILTGGARVIKESLSIFLELTPPGYNTDLIAKEIARMPEVMGIHDIHIWAVAHRRIAFSAHVWVHDQKLSEAEPIRKKIESRLKEMGISHVIMQLECGECETNGLYCQIYATEE